jgi:hypothetical protein
VTEEASSGAATGRLIVGTITDVITDHVGVLLDGDIDGAPIRVPYHVVQLSGAWTGDLVAVEVDADGSVSRFEKITGEDDEQA